MAAENLGLDPNVLYGIPSHWEESNILGVFHQPDPVSEYNNPGLMMMMFPSLFPFGVGGPEDDRRVHVSPELWTRHCLQLEERKFVVHPTFSFVRFNQQQRHQVSRKARFQIKAPFFQGVSSVTSGALRSILDRMSTEQGLHELLAESPSVSALFRSVRTIGSHIEGSPSARLALRKPMEGLTMRYGPPMLWVTVNLADLHDPKVGLFAGHQISVDSPLPHDRLPLLQRAELVTRDGAAVARWFHTVVVAILQSLAGWKGGTFGRGVFGRLCAFFGTVETQGRGSLHLHMLMWLKGLNAEYVSQILQ
ncbi:MAG: hypothetical protein KIT69_21895, partial [Propionibacteriaceae bacterium]|nr:hypothetical protein [Propionibacteriaceae bacterium]